MVHLEWYRSFVNVYQVGTVSGAAEVLHLTQPAVSQHIAALESTLGTVLFQRMPRRMLPTEAGKAAIYSRGGGNRNFRIDSDQSNFSQCSFGSSVRYADRVF